MRIRPLLLVLAIGVAAFGWVPVPTAAEFELVSNANPAIATINVGAYPNQYSSVPYAATYFDVQVRNDGDDPIFINNVATSPTSGDVRLFCSSNCYPFLGVGDSAVMEFRAEATNGADTGVTTGTITIDSDNGTVVVRPRINVRNWRPPTFSPPDAYDVPVEMPCPRTEREGTIDFGLSFTNSGDYNLFVESVGVRDLPFGLQSLSGFGGFNVAATSTEDREYRLSLPPDTRAGTHRGLVDVYTNANDATIELEVTVTQPVRLDLPSAGAIWDFGNVPILGNPSPWNGVLVEECGYQDVTVRIANPSELPTFVAPSQSHWTVPAGNELEMEVGVRFTSEHIGLLYQEQAFEVDVEASSGERATYRFRAVPVFINVDQYKDRLEHARDASSFPDAREAADGILGLLINRTETNPPRTEADIEDASRVVSLVEPAALIVEQFDAMKAWNEDGEEERTVAALVAVAAAQTRLADICDSIQETGLRPPCHDAVARLRTCAAQFSHEARSHFANLTATGRTDLELERAASGLALVLAALGQTEEAAASTAQAEQHFDNFIKRLDEAEARENDIDERAQRLQPWAFADTGEAFVAWQPLGLPFLVSFRDDARQDYEAAEESLAAAGDAIRLQALEEERQAFEAKVAASWLPNVLVLGAYGLAVAAAATWGAVAWASLKNVGSTNALGDLLLPERGRKPD